MAVKLEYERNKLPGMSAALRRELAQAVASTALEIEGAAKELIQTSPATGRTYLIYQGGKAPVEHRASAPGEPPATDTGNLVNSIQADTDHVRADLTAEVEVGAEYGVYLEYGTVRMAARPFLNPAVDGEQDRFRRRIRVAVEKAAH